MKIFGINLGKDQGSVASGKRKTRRRPSLGALIGQTVVLFFFLVLGAGVARFGAYYGSPPISSKSGGKLVEYRNLELRNAVIKHEDVKGFSQLSLFARIIEPQDASANVVVYGLKDDGSASEIQRINRVSSTWTSFDQQITYSAIEIRLETQSALDVVSQTSPSPLAGETEESNRSGSSKNTSGSAGQDEVKKTNKGQEDLAKLGEHLPTKIDLLVFLRPK